MKTVGDRLTEEANGAPAIQQSEHVEEDVEKSCVEVGRRREPVPVAPKRQNLEVANRVGARHGLEQVVGEDQKVDEHQQTCRHRNARDHLGETSPTTIARIRRRRRLHCSMQNILGCRFFLLRIQQLLNILSLSLSLCSVWACEQHTDERSTSKLHYITHKKLNEFDGFRLGLRQTVCWFLGIPMFFWSRL